MPNDTRASGAQTVIWRSDDTVCIRILRRKNRPSGSGTIMRKCTCKGGLHTCAVHFLWDKFFDDLPIGAAPWADIPAGLARERLRRVLRRLGVPNAEEYGVTLR